MGIVLTQLNLWRQSLSLASIRVKSTAGSPTNRLRSAASARPPASAATSSCSLLLAAEDVKRPR